MYFYLLVEVGPFIFQLTIFLTIILVLTVIFGWCCDSGLIVAIEMLSKNFTPQCTYNLQYKVMVGYTKI